MGSCTFLHPEPKKADAKDGSERGATKGLAVPMELAADRSTLRDLQFQAPLLGASGSLGGERGAFAGCRGLHVGFGWGLRIMRLGASGLRLPTQGHISHHTSACRLGAALEGLPTRERIYFISAGPFGQLYIVAKS